MALDGQAHSAEAEARGPAMDPVGDRRFRGLDADLRQLVHEGGVQAVYPVRVGRYQIITLSEWDRSLTR
jgi:hypothetical protein